MLLDVINIHLLHNDFFSRFDAIKIKFQLYKGRKNFKLNFKRVVQLHELLSGMSVLLKLCFIYTVLVLLRITKLGKVEIVFGRSTMNIKITKE